MWQGVGDFPMVVFSSFVSHPSGASKFGWEPLRFTDGCGLLYRSLAINRDGILEKSKARRRQTMKKQGQ